MFSLITSTGFSTILSGPGTWTSLTTSTIFSTSTGFSTIFSLIFSTSTGTSLSTTTSLITSTGTSTIFSTSFSIITSLGLSSRAFNVFSYFISNDDKAFAILSALFFWEALSAIALAASSTALGLSGPFKIVSFFEPLGGVGGVLGPVPSKFTP